MSGPQGHQWACPSVGHFAIAIGGSTVARSIVLIRYCKTYPRKHYNMPATVFGIFSLLTVLQWFVVMFHGLWCHIHRSQCYIFLGYQKRRISWAGFLIFDSTPTNRRTDFVCGSQLELSFCDRTRFLWTTDFPFALLQECAADHECATQPDPYYCEKACVRQQLGRSSFEIPMHEFTFH